MGADRLGAIRTALAGRLACFVLAAVTGLAGSRPGAAQQPTRAADEQASPVLLAITRLDDRTAAPDGERAQPAGQGGQLPSNQRLLPLVVTQLEERRRGALETGRLISVRPARPLPIRELLPLLVRDTPFSIAAASEVDGVFVGELNDVTLRQALDIVTVSLGLDYAVDDTLIRVFPRKLETRLFDVNYVATRRISRRTFGGPGVRGASSVEASAVDDADLHAELAEGVRTLLSEQGRFNLDRKAALLQVTDYDDRLDRVRLYLETVQNRAARQVQIDARVIEVVLAEQFAAGVDWTVLLGGEVLFGPGGILAGLDRLGPSGLLAALAEQGAVEVLATPRVVTMNNEPAVMRVGRQQVVFTTTSELDPATGRVVRTTSTPQAITEGLLLTVTPQISEDGFIQLAVSPSLTERTGPATALGSVGPALAVREVDTLVRVRDRQTVVIAGLLRAPAGAAAVPSGRSDRRGATAGPDARRQGRSELVILLTPTIVNPGALSSDGGGASQPRGSAAGSGRER